MYINKHHYPPETRRAKSHIVKMPKKFHDQWHHLFYNFFGFESALCLVRIQALCLQAKNRKVFNDEIKEEKSRIMVSDQGYTKSEIKENAWQLPGYDKLTAGELNESDRLTEKYSKSWKGVFENLHGDFALALLWKIHDEFQKKRYIDYPDIRDLRSEVSNTIKLS